MIMIIGNKYKIKGKIGNGAFGCIYKGLNIRTDEEVAIKVESIESGTKLLKKEAQIYQYLGIIDNFPQLKWFGKDSLNYYMVINLYGESIKDRIEKNGKMPIKEAIDVAIQMIERIEVLHDKLIIHRDIKPENVLYGLTSQVIIIDYGLSKCYEIKGKHMEEKDSKIIGTEKYASENVRNGKSGSRRDDVESIINVFRYMIGESENEILCKIYKSVRMIKYEERPEYSEIKCMLKVK